MFTYQLAPHNGLQASSSESLDAAVELQVLPDGEQLEQRVELRAVPDAPSNVRLVVADAEPVDVGLTRGGGKLAGEDGQRGGLARAVDA